MESQPNAGYFPHTDSIQAVIQGFPCFPYPEQTTTAPANDTWEYTQYDRNTGLLIYPPRGGAASEPSFAEDFQIPQVPQSPFLQTRPQPAGPSTTEENRMPIEPARKQPTDPATRRDLARQKATLLDMLRVVMGIKSTTTTLEVLNAAIERLEGVVPQGHSGGRGEGIKLAYNELDRLTGCQGTLRHARCLERVIEALNGKPTLDPIIYRGPSFDSN